MSDFPREADADLFDVIERSIIGHPRSQQERIGPSGIGDPCDKSLVYGLAGWRPERKPYSGWKPTIGTAGHAWMEARFIEENERLGYTRWLTERRVVVGQILGDDLPGTMDLFDLFRGEVTDFKFVGPKRLLSFRANGPGDKYRVQAHLYGAGVAALGIVPKTVAIAYMPRDGELTSAYVWREPWDPNVGAEAMGRANRLALRLRDEFGGDPEAMTDGWENCTEQFCDWCRPGRRFIQGKPKGSMFD